MNKIASKKILVDFTKAKKGTQYDDHYTLVTAEGVTIGFEAKVVDELPETGEKGFIYLVPKDESNPGDVYEEYVWALGKDGSYGWEHIGSTDVKIEIDDELSDTSENPVQNKVIKDALDNIPVPTVVQTTGTSTTDVMSQNAVTSMVFNNPASKSGVKIGDGATGNSSSVTIGGYANGRQEKSVAIGQFAKVQDSGAVAIGSGSNRDTAAGALGVNSVAVGYEAKASGNLGIAVGYQANAGLRGTAIGDNASSNALYSVAIGNGATATVKGQFDIGTGNGDYSAGGYNNSNYRLLTGLYDPQSAHDAATKGYVDTQIGAINTALQTLLNGTGA